MFVLDFIEQLSAFVGVCSVCELDWDIMDGEFAFLFHDYSFALNFFFVS